MNKEHVLRKKRNIIIKSVVVTLSVLIFLTMFFNFFNDKESYSLASTESAVATLENLSLNSGDSEYILSEKDGSLLAFVDENVNSLTISSELTNDSSEYVSGYGNRTIQLNSKINRELVKVKAENGVVDIYTLTIIKGDCDIAIMKVFPETIIAQRDNIVEVKFIKDTQTNIDARYNAATIKEELNYKESLSIKGWLEPTDADSTKCILYVASASEIYFSSSRGMFATWGNLEKIDFSNVNNSLNSNMENMFAHCPKLTSLDLSNFDTSNVTTMQGMFFWSEGLTSLDLSNFDTSNVTKMAAMFAACSSLTELDLSTWDTFQVTSMEGMFSMCSKLISIELSNFCTENVINISTMFAGCEELTTVDLSSFDLTNVKDMSGIFEKCSKLDYKIKSTYFKINDNYHYVHVLVEYLYNGLVARYDKDDSLITIKNRFNHGDYFTTFDYNDNKVRYDIVINGDANDDGKLSETDFMQIAYNVYIDSNSLSDKNKYAADFNNDGQVKSGDFMQLAHKLYAEGL